ALIRELFYGPEPERSKVCDEALHIAASLDDPSVSISVGHACLNALWQEPNMIDRVAAILSSQAGSALDPLREWSRPAIRKHLAILRGDFATGIAAAARMEAVVETLQSPYRRFITRHNSAAIACASGKLDDAQRLANEALTIAEESGQPDAGFYFAAVQALI